MRRLVIATGNAGKVRELTALLAPIPLVTLPRDPPVDLPEPGEDYVTNATSKAIAASEATGGIVLADDSGLDVDALGGSPGWRSARYGGGHGDDAANRAALLAAMSDVPDGLRSARFRCVVAVADVRGALGRRVLLGFGACDGAIARGPRGTHGFGYDPIVVVARSERTVAELTDEEKQALSHRSRAIAAVRPALMAYMATSALRAERD